MQQPIVQPQNGIFVITGESICAEDIKASVALFDSINDEEKATYAEKLTALFEQNNEIIFCVKHREEVIATLVLLPIETNFLNEWCEGKHESVFENLEFPAGIFRKYDTPGKYSLLFELLAVNPAYNRVEIIKNVMEVFGEKILEWARKSIFIEANYTEAYNREGERIAHFFGMEEVRKTTYGKIFKASATPEKLIAMLPNNLNEYNQYYFDYFGTYRF